MFVEGILHSVGGAWEALVRGELVKQGKVQYGCRGHDKRRSDMI